MLVFRLHPIQEVILSHPNHQSDAQPMVAEFFLVECNLLGPVLRMEKETNLLEDQCYRHV